MLSSRAVLSALLIGVLSCSAAKVVAPVPVAELRAAPVSVVVGGQQLVLATYLYRDFQPISPRDGKPLIAGLRVQAADGAPLVTSFDVDAAWVVNGAEVWAASVGEARLATPRPMYYEVVARDGPKWGPGVRVDVMVRIREKSGPTYLPRAAGQLIGRTD